MANKNLFFTKKEDAKNRFPDEELALVFDNMYGWVWTSKSIARGMHNKLHMITKLNINDNSQSTEERWT